MRELMTAAGVRIETYETDEPVPQDTTADYVIKRIDPLSSEEIFALTETGYRFLDRMLFMDIDLKSTAAQRAATVRRAGDIEYSVDEDFSGIYALAGASYVSDRRFHLDPVFSMEKAIPVLDAYIGYYRDRGAKIVKAKHEEELLGCCVIDLNADPKGKYFENVLGATIPGIKGKLIAAQLYNYMLEFCSDRFARYRGRVSASNLASVNLHINLGAKVSQIYDELILSR